MDLSVTTDFPSLCVKYISISVFSKIDFIDILQNSLPMSTHVLYGLRVGSSKIF